MKNVLRSFRRRLKWAALTKVERRHAMAGPPKLWKQKRDYQINFLKDAGLKPKHYLLDLGCGTLRGGIPLIDYLQEGHYFGIDSRKKVLDEARKELREAGLEWKNPTLSAVADISQERVQQKFDFIWAFSVLIHMSDEILHDTLYFVKVHLLDKGIFYANVNIGGKKEGHWQRFPVVWRDLNFYEEACSRCGLILSDIGPLKNLGHITDIKSQDEQRMLRIRKA